MTPEQKLQAAKTRMDTRGETQKEAAKAVGISNKKLTGYQSSYNPLPQSNRHRTPSPDADGSSGLTGQQLSFQA